MTTPFIHYEGETLQEQFILAPTDTLRVVSILGKPQSGKSTFLNAILHMLEAPEPKELFCTQSDIENCKPGIDSYYCADRSILFLDCQGLTYNLKTLLLLYTVSDVMIINEKTQLTKDALDILKPIHAFSTVLKEGTVPKPHLIFRVCECDSLTRIRDNLSTILYEYDERYQSIRDDIMRYFRPQIGIVKTNRLSVTEKAAIYSNIYSVLFRNPENGFQEAVDSVLRFLPPGRSSTVWLSRLPRLVEQINQAQPIVLEDAQADMKRLELLHQHCAFELRNDSASFSNRDPPYHVPHFDEFRKDTKHEAWIHKQETVLEKALADAKQNEQEQLEAIATQCRLALANFRVEAMEHIQSEKDANALTDLRISTLRAMTASLHFTPVCIEVTVGAGTLTANTKKGEEILLDASHDLIKSTVDSFVADVEKYERLYKSRVVPSVQTAPPLVKQSCCLFSRPPQYVPPPSPVSVSTQR